MIVMCDTTNSLSDPTPSKIKKRRGRSCDVTFDCRFHDVASSVYRKICFSLKSNKPNSYGYFNVLREGK